MSDFRIESRRARYMRLARAATEAAAKSPLPGAKEMYVRLAQAWVAMADEHDHGPDICSDDAAAGTEETVPPRGGLNVKLNGIP
jgi:hypothetical protein